MNVHDWDNMTDAEKRAEMDKIETQKKARFKRGKKHHITRREIAESAGSMAMGIFGRVMMGYGGKIKI